MTRIRRMQTALVVGTLVLTVGASIVEADLPANAPWSFEAIAGITGGDVGKHTSIAFHPATGKPYITYYDETNGDLRLIYPHATAGNCGPNNEWYCEAVDTIGDVGQYSSIDYFHDDATGQNKIGIAYYDATNQALKVAIWSTSPSPGWRASIVDSESLPGDSHSVGRYAAMKFDSTGAVHVAYTNSFPFISGDLHGLLYAHSVASGGNCGLSAAAGKWQCDPVESSASSPVFFSLGLTTSDTPAVVYSDSSSDRLKICVESGGSWPCVDVDLFAGGPVSLAIDQSNHPHMAYYDPDSGELKYATYVGSAGNCGYGVADFLYQCDSLDTIGEGQNQVGISIDMDTADYPIIAYQEDSDPVGFPVLNVARPVFAHGTTTGNCGPIVALAHRWQCTTIDDATQGGGAGSLYEADFAAVGIAPNGLAHIAYYENDDYNGEGRLKYAAQVDAGLIFRDGFDAGNTTAWSSVVDGQ